MQKPSMPPVVHLLGTAVFAQGTSEFMVAGLVPDIASDMSVSIPAATVTSLVPPDAKGRALAVLLAGTTIACVAGVPGGAALGGLWGWRTAFWAVSLLCVPALVAVLTSVPRDRPDAVPPSARGELRVLRRPRLLGTLLLGALVNGATFCSFTFLAPVLTDVAGIDAVWIPALLALFGGGSFLGVRLAARWSDTRPGPLLAGGGTLLAAGWAGFALVAGNAAAAVILVPLLGTLAFAVGSTLIARALYAGSDAPNLAGGFATASLNVGAAAGPCIGGMTIAAGLGLGSPLWVSAALVTAALALAVLSG